MSDDPKEAAPNPSDNRETQSTKEGKADARKALKEQQKRELPSNDWPGKGAA